MKKTQHIGLTKDRAAKLVDALLHEKLTVVEHFLKQGWDPRRPLDGSNALNFVGGQKSAKVLIRAGVDPNTRFNSLPPLMIHASSSNDKVVDFLLGVGADPNCRLSADRYGVVPGGTTALMMAAGQGLLLIVRRLLDAGADINAVDDNRHNALFWCLRWDKGDVAKELLRRGSPLTDDVLCGPVKHGNVGLAKLLLRKHPNVNSVFSRYEDDKTWPDGQTLLGYAISQAGTLDYPTAMYRLLVNAGADVNQPSKWFFSRKSGSQLVPVVGPVPPLRIAGGKGLREVIATLRKAGAEGTLKEAMADCTLERAVFRNRPEIVRLLIEAGYDVNEFGTETGKRPIELARKGGFPGIVRLLKRAGARE